MIIKDYSQVTFLHFLNFSDLFLDSQAQKCHKNAAIVKISINKTSESQFFRFSHVFLEST